MGVLYKAEDTRLISTWWKGRNNGSTWQRYQGSR